MANATSTVVEANDENNTASEDFIVVDGSISGFVADNGTTPMFLPGATVQLVQLERSYVADDVTGNYRFLGVPAGTYTLRTTQKGYLQDQRTIVVSGQRVTANIRMTFETVPAMLSMQTGAVYQLGVVAPREVDWSGSNANATVSSTGLITVLSGGEVSATVAQDATFTGTAANGATGRQVQVNSFAFDLFPRELKLVWAPVNTAVSYLVEWQFGNGPGSGAECGGIPENCTTWTALGSTVVAGTNHTIAFVGKQPGRWRITPTLASGEVLAPSLWVWFDFDV
jgi:hypothetical protein